MTTGFKPKKSWKEKVETDCAATFAQIPPIWEKKMGVGQMVITSPKLMYDLVMKIPKGSLVLQDEIRRKFASDFNVQSACPMTTGIFLRIAAEAAEEYKSEGAKNIAPVSYTHLDVYKRQIHTKTPISNNYSTA